MGEGSFLKLLRSKLSKAYNLCVIGDASNDNRAEYWYGTGEIYIGPAILIPVIRHFTPVIADNNIKTRCAIRPIMQSSVRHIAVSSGSSSGCEVLHWHIALPLTRLIGGHKLLRRRKAV